MKNWLRRNALGLCSSCLALAHIYHIGRFSIVLFGEPEFPTED